MYKTLKELLDHATEEQLITAENNAHELTAAEYLHNETRHRYQTNLRNMLELVIALDEIKSSQTVI